MDRPDPRKLWALVVGISKYAHVEPLRFAGGDARSVGDFLKSPRGGSVPDDHLVMLLEGEATRHAVLTEIELLQDKVQEGDTVYIYVAGHGFVNRRNIGYFIPADGKLETPAATSVSFTTLKELVEVGLAHAHTRVLITDMCRAGKIGPEKSELAERIENLVNEELAKFGRGRGGPFLNLLASRARQNSYEREELGHGVFTWALLEALNGRAARQGETVVSVGDAVAFVQSEVPKLTASQQQPVANRDYDPTMPLSFLNLPGVPSDDTPEVTVLITRRDRAPYSRVEWDDARTMSKAVVLLLREQETVRIPSLSPGELVIRLYESGDRFRSIKVNLGPGENRLDLSSALIGGYRLERVGDRRVASQQPVVPSSVAARPASAGEAALMLRLDPAAELYLDGGYYGAGAGTLIQLRGLAPGPHYLRLLPSPQREQRFRVRLLPGPQLFDPGSGEIRYFDRLPAALPALPLPAGLPAAMETPYRLFVRSLWEKRLVGPPGSSAWDLFGQIGPALPSSLRIDLAARLAVALGDRAQETVLKYVRGGDVRWSAEVFDEGLLLVQRAAQLRPSARYESMEHFFAGRGAIERGQYDVAIPELQRSLQLDPEASHAANAIGLAWWKQNRLDLAIPALERAISLSPFWAYPRVTLALIYLEQRRYRDSEEAFQSCLRINSEDSTACHGLGQLNLLQERWADAEGQLERALEFNPGNAYACETLGKLHQALSRPGRAEEMFRLAIRLEPDEPAFQASLADLLRQSGRNDEAGEILARAAAGHPTDLRVLRVYGDLLSATGGSERADALFQDALRAAPEDANLRLLYGTFLRRGQRLDEAESQLQRAVRIAPGNAQARSELASLYVLRKKVPDAERELEAALRADPRLPAPLRLQGQLLFARNRYAEAIGSYRRALATSTRAYERQELTELIDAATASLVSERLEQAQESLRRRSPREAWEIYAQTLALAPDDAKVRGALLSLQEEQPAAADLSVLPPSGLTDVLKTRFWREQLAAEGLWKAGRKSEAATRFSAALEQMDATERRKVGSSAFNVENEERSVHQIVTRWTRRMIETGETGRASRLLATAADLRFFGTVPDFQPLTVDSLMWPADVSEPREFKDFEVAKHPDRRAHELNAALRALAGDMEGCRSYLVALEQAGLDLRARLFVAEQLDRVENREPAIELLRGVLAEAKRTREPELLADMFLRMAEIQCRAGDCAAARDTLRQGEKQIPGDARIREALKKLR